MEVRKIIILNGYSVGRSNDTMSMVKDFIDILSVSFIEVKEYEWLADIPMEKDARYLLFLEPFLLSDTEKAEVVEELLLKVGKENVFMLLEEEQDVLQAKYPHFPFYKVQVDLLSMDDLENLYLLDFVKDVLKAKHEVDKKEVIYLAAAESKYEKYRKHLRRELERRGYKVLPREDDGWVFNEKEPTIENEEHIFSMIKSCVFSIHFGKQELNDIRGKRSNRILLENSIAYQLEKAKYKHDSSDINNFKRIIWDFNGKVGATSDLEYTEKQSKKTEYLHSSIDQLKTFVLRQLENDSKNLESGKQEKEQSVKAYFIFKEKQREHIQILENKLVEKQIEVIKTFFSDDFDENRKQYEKALIECDVCFIFHDEDTDREWLNSKIHDLLKVSGKRTKSILQAKAILTKDNPKDVLTYVDDEEMEVIKYSEEGIDAIIGYIEGTKQRV